MQKVVRVQFPQGSMAVLGHKIAQKEIDGVLLLSVCVRIAVEAANGGHEVPGLGGGLPVPPLPLEKGGVGLRAPVLHTQTLSSDSSASYQLLAAELGCKGCIPSGVALLHMLLLKQSQHEKHEDFTHCTQHSTAQRSTGQHCTSLSSRDLPCTNQIRCSASTKA